VYILNNEELVGFVKNALNDCWGYVWGTFGQVLTIDLLTQKARQYPTEVGGKVEFISRNWMNRKVADCVGLIKGAYWTIDGNLRYEPSTDVSADGMFNLATEKGTIDTIPEIPGICLWKKGHIGVYCGGGQVIEARGTFQGVIDSSLKGPTSPGWTHWLKCPYIDYPIDTTIPNTTPSSKIYEMFVQGDVAKELQVALNVWGVTDNNGNSLEVDGYLGDCSNQAMSKVFIKGNAKGLLIEVIQKRLMSLGFNLQRYGADGEMSSGGETERAVIDFQRSRQLEDDGIIGKNTMTELFKK
jgi:hypothetical protein